jgi:type IV secretory pathway VirB9-like protein
MFKITLCILCIVIATATAQSQGYPEGGFQDITNQASGGPKSKASNDIMRPDTNADVDMERVSNAFNKGMSEASDTIIYRQYDPQSSVGVRTRKYMTTLISIPKGRKIKEVISADSKGFHIQHMGKDSANQVAIVPLAFDIDTNLVLTDQSDNIYTFYIRSEAIGSKQTPHFAVVLEEEAELLLTLDLKAEGSKIPVTLVKDYTGKKGSIGNEADKEDKLLINSLSREEYDFLRTLEASSNVNTHYRMFGERSIAPNAVWDDGKQTYISFRDGTPSQRIPNVYRLVDGYGVIVNYHYRDGFFVVDAVSEEGWMLIDGNKVVCIKSPKYDRQKSMKGKIQEVEFENEAALFK